MRGDPLPRHPGLAGEGERVDDPDVRAAVRAEGVMVLPRLALEACRALALLHAGRRTHGALTAARIRVRPRPRLGSRVVLVEWNPAERSAAASDPRPGEPGFAAWLPYRAPETLDGRRAGPRADLWALGVSLFEAMHGRPPFRPRADDDPENFAEAVRGGRRIRPAPPDGASPAFCAWVESLLEAEAARRPASAGAALLALLRTDALPESPEPETPAGALGRFDAAPCAGREELCTRLRDVVLGADGPRVVLVAGPEGSGRRQLCRRLAGEAAEAGIPMLDAAATPAADVSPQDAATDLLVRWRRRAGEGIALATIEQAEPPWTSPTVLDVLERIAHEPDAPALRVAVVVETSSGGEAPALARLRAQAGRAPGVLAVDVPPLDVDGLRAAAERATLVRPAAAESRKRLRETAGLPGRLRALLAGGSPDPGAPPPLWDAVSLPARSWAAAVAALDGPAAVEAADALTGLEPDVAERARHEAAAAGLVVRRVSGWEPEPPLRAEAILDALDPDARRTLLARAADTVEAGPGAPDSRRRARILARAGRVERAIELLLAEADARSGDDAEAQTGALEDALRLLPRRDPRRAELRRRLARAAVEARRPHRAVRALGAALRHAADDAERAELLARQAASLVSIGRFARARAVARRALAEAASPRVAAEAHRALGVALARDGRPGEAVEHLRAAVEAGAESGAPEAPGARLERAASLCALALCEYELGRDGEAAGHHHRSIELYEEAGRPERGLANWNGLAQIDLRAARFGEAKKWLLRARGLAERGRDLRLHAVLTANLARACTGRNELDRAVGYALEAEEQARAQADRRLVRAARAFRAEALVAAGRAPEAARLLDATIDDREDDIDPGVRALARAARLEALLAAGTTEATELAAACAELIEVAGSLDDPDALPWALVLDLERRVAHPGTDGVVRAGEALDALFARGAPWDSPVHRTRAALALARAALLRGEPEEATREARAAVELAQRHDLHAPAAAAEALLVEILRDDPAAAVRHQDRGRRLLDHAAQFIQDPEWRRGFLERPAFAPLLDAIHLAPSTVDRRLVALYDMGRKLNSEDDPEAIVDALLDMALGVVRAERGLILLRRDDDWTVRAARNLEPDTAVDAEAFSRGVVSAAASGRAVLAVDTQQDRRFRDLESVSRYGIRSVLCVPLKLRGAIVGAVYLDSRKEGTLFTEDDRQFLEAFADQAALALENARRRRALERENRRLRDAAAARVHFGNIVGESDAMREVFDQIGKVAASELPVLILGESGTGKELVARAVHFHGPRAERAFLSENCAAIPDTLLQSELFGHVAGSFTGAERDRQGLFELADGGTLFLDEVGDMSPAMQGQLLRVLQEGEARPIGADRPVEFDVRPIFATHRDLEARVQDGTFREDLWFRISVLTLRVPPLRERKGDLPILARHILGRIARDRGRPEPALDPALLARLEEYPWPGNVRQLENVLQRLTLLAPEGRLGLSAIDRDPALRRMLDGGDGPVATPRPHAPLSLEVSERERILEALKTASGNRTRAARFLGISRATLYRKLREHGIGG